MSFPSNFLWGASTSSHQVEGETTNQWTRWEAANAHGLARSATKHYGSLPQWSTMAPTATDPANYLSGSASDEYHRYPEDLRLAAHIGLNAYRFSLEWSRLEPSEGQFDAEELAHYRSLIQAMKSQGIEPMVTLWHWTLPIWLADKGGWENKRTPALFARYASTVAEALGSNVHLWVTINEPGVYAGNSYLRGIWPPQQKNLFKYLRVTKHLLKGHQVAYAALKATNPKAQVGIAHHLFQVEPASHHWYDQITATLFTWWANRFFLEHTLPQQDFIGVNYYFQKKVGVRGIQADPTAPRSDLGWELHPEGIYPVLLSLQRYNLPVYITESGLADAEDKQRAWYITQTLTQVQRVITAGVEVRGYFYWSLIDNFEWAEGKWPRFGLVAVDYATQKRTIRPSAATYSTIIKQNGITK